MTADRNRVTLAVTVDLDPIPGVCHTAASWCEWLQALLTNLAGSYDPRVEIGKVRT